MYLTAHRARSPAGQEAIQVFHHHHHPRVQVWPDDVVDWPESNPGELVQAHHELSLGGSTVRSYLDVLAPDGTPPAVILAALSVLGRDLPERRNPTALVVPPVTMRMGLELGMETRREEEFGALAGALCRLLSAPTAD